MIQKHRKTPKERAVTFLIVMLAVATVVIFFNLDIINDGESMFSRTADEKLMFRGDLKRKAYTAKEIDRLLAFIKKNEDLITQAVVETSYQDSYKKVTERSPVVFEVFLTLKGEATVSTPARRTTRGKLVDSILTKLKKDMKAYRQLLKEGKPIRSLINTM